MEQEQVATVKARTKRNSSADCGYIEDNEAPVVKKHRVEPLDSWLHALHAVNPFPNIQVANPVPVDNAKLHTKDASISSDVEGNRCTPMNSASEVQFRTFVVRNWPFKKEGLVTPVFRIVDFPKSQERVSLEFSAEQTGSILTKQCFVEEKPFLVPHLDLGAGDMPLSEFNEVRGNSVRLAERKLMSPVFRIIDFPNPQEKVSFEAPAEETGANPKEQFFTNEDSLSVLNKDFDAGSMPLSKELQESSKSLTLMVGQATTSSPEEHGQCNTTIDAPSPDPMDARKLTLEETQVLTEQKGNRDFEKSLIKEEQAVRSHWNSVQCASEQRPSNSLVISQVNPDGSIPSKNKVKNNSSSVSEEMQLVVFSPNCGRETQETTGKEKLQDDDPLEPYAAEELRKISQKASLEHTDRDGGQQVDSDMRRTRTRMLKKKARCTASADIDASLLNAIVPFEGQVGYALAEMVDMNNIEAMGAENFDEEELKAIVAVQRALREYAALRRHIMQEEGGVGASRSYLEAASLMRRNMRTVNNDASGNPLIIIGKVPGVPVGQQFYYRQELLIVGLHRLLQAGIDYISPSKNKYKKTISTAVIASGGYEDDLDQGEWFDYTGQGGNNYNGDKKQSCDQELKRGNLGLKNSCDLGLPVRVIRGNKEPNSDSGTVYTYDGLYKVESWRETVGGSGHKVYKFRLVRLQGQPPLSSPTVEFVRTSLKSNLKSSERRGVVVEDISNGLEKIPICCVNTVDNPPVPPPRFTYINKVNYSDSVELQPHEEGCSCRDDCASIVKCTCASGNSQSFPYTKSGQLVEVLPAIFECGTMCRCKSNKQACPNRVTQNGIRYRLEVFKTNSKGWAVRSWDAIPSGAFICEYVGKLYDDEDAEESLKGRDEYLFNLDLVRGNRDRWGDVSELYGMANVNSTALQDLEEAKFCLDAKDTVGMEMYQSEVNNTMFVHYVRRIVQPMMLQLKKLVDPKIKLELKVGRNNSKEKGILEESRKLRATILVLGSNARSMFGMGSSRRATVTTGTGAYCVRVKPARISVFVIQKDKVILSKESDGTSPLSSTASSPSSSGRLGIINQGARDMSIDSSGQLSPKASDTDKQLSRTSSHSSVGSGEITEEDSTDGRRARLTQSGTLPGSESFPEESTISRGPPSTFPVAGAVSSGVDVTMSPITPPIGAGARALSASNRLLGLRAGKYGTWSGSKALADTSDASLPTAGVSGIPPLAPERSVGSGGLPSDDSGSGHMYALRPETSMDGGEVNRTSSASSLSSENLSGDIRMKTQEDYVADLDAWSQSQREALEKQQQAYMKDLEGRLMKARAALVSFPMATSNSSTEAMITSAGEKLTTAASKVVEGVRIEGMDISNADLHHSSTNIESDLLKELALMRRKAADAEQARIAAEKRAEQLMTAADLSLREVEEQSKKRELENAVLIERATLEATRAMASAEEARRIAVLEAQKTEQALTQAAITRSALEHEVRKRAEAEQKAEKEMEARRQLKHYRQYSWEELTAATDSFSHDRKLGEGGFGTVYAGTLHHTPVAVKVLKNTDALQAASEFQQEVEVLGQIQHPHMVMLLGCCPDKYCLVYEFMANGSLEERLLCANNTPPLPWYMRLRIAAEVASALLILHTRPVPIVHRDLKPANILLDKNFVAKLGDVGLARLMPELSDNQTYMRESVPVGTFAYVDPEFQRTGEFGPKSDVYALGIVLLDLLTGRKPNVYEHLEDAVDNGDMEKLASFLDEKAGDWPVEVAMEVAQIAVRCSEMRRKKRPDLEQDVMPPLEKVRDIAAKAEDEEMNVRRGRPLLGDAPSSLFCPITQEIMVNPVLAADGHTYELIAIQQWLENNDRSPMTNVTLPNKDLVPNHAVKSLIREWQERNSRALHSPSLSFSLSMSKGRSK